MQNKLGLLMVESLVVAQAALSPQHLAAERARAMDGNKIQLYDMKMVGAPPSTFTRFLKLQYLLNSVLVVASLQLPGR